jgi:hypothetical protein
VVAQDRDQHAQEKRREEREHYAPDRPRGVGRGRDRRDLDDAHAGVGGHLANRQLAEPFADGLARGGRGVLLLKALELVREPLARAGRDLLLGSHALGDEGVGHGVRDARDLHRVLPGRDDVEDAAHVGVDGGRDAAPKRLGGLARKTPRGGLEHRRCRDELGAGGESAVGGLDVDRLARGGIVGDPRRRAVPVRRHQRDGKHHAGHDHHDRRHETGAPPDRGRRAPQVDRRIGVGHRRLGSRSVGGGDLLGHRHRHGESTPPAFGR